MKRKYGPKEVLERITSIIEAWENLRPTKSFSGLTLEQFKELVKPMFDARKRITELDKQRQAAYTDRDAADSAALGHAKLVVNAVTGDREETEDGALYAAMGYVRRGQRDSGLTRRRVKEKEEVKTE